MRGADNSPDATLLVDIGGSVGHDLEEFHKHHPSTPGKLILQDLPAVIGDIKGLDPAITPMEHNFYTEQLIKGEVFASGPPELFGPLQTLIGVPGARAYYMHSVLHDWPDSVC